MSNTSNTSAVNNVTPSVKLWAILPAAGVGSRMQADRPKQYLDIEVAGLRQQVIEVTLQRLLSYQKFQKIVVVVSNTDPYWPQLDFKNEQRVLVADGGQERCDSVLNGLLKLEGIAADNDLVAVHDIARPCISHQDIDLLFSQLQASQACGAILANPVRDTMKRSRSETADNKKSQQLIDHTVEREQLWHALTPQVFPYKLLKDALQSALDNNQTITDEASAIEYLGLSPLLVEGRSDNIKITRPQDLQLAELFLNEQIKNKILEGNALFRQF